MNHKAAIHIIKAQLALSDDDYRFHLEQASAGTDSCSAMSAIQLAKTRAYFDAMAQRSGIARKPVEPAKARKPVKRTRPLPSKDSVKLCRRIRAQLISLGRLPDTYADGIAKQMFGDAAPQFYEWCHADQLYKITQALGVEQKRKGAPLQ
jgi:phage gp16-like protein